MSGKKSAPGPRRPRRWRNWKKRLLWGGAIVPAAYLLLTGPALWSRSVVANDGWRTGVAYYVAPLMWLDYQFRGRTPIERAGLIDLREARHTCWYGWMETYWSLFGRQTAEQADRIALALKFRLR